MHFTEVLTIILCVLILGGIIGRYIYKKVKGLPTGECACCKSKKTNRLLKEYRKKYGKQNCNCSK